jgi:uncharacterized membrane protein
VNKALKLLLIAVCVVGAALSFLFFAEREKNAIGENYADCYFNIEIDKAYVSNVKIISGPPQDEIYVLSSTDDSQDLSKTVVYVKIPITGFLKECSLLIPENEVKATLAAIDNVSIFVGNKLFYFSHADIQKLPIKIKDGYAICLLPNVHYAWSILAKDVINSYGDINLAIISAAAFFIYPARFAVTWFFLLILLFLFRRSIANAYCTAKKHSTICAAILLCVIIFAGFLLRINGYVRHSGWLDEIYTANASSPIFPFLRTFSDPGNPPFYFIVLRLFFSLFGWSEETGRLFSVIIGTLVIPALYLLVKPFFGKKAALLAALFMAFSTYAIGYSQEMRSNILRFFLVTISAFCFLNFLKKQSCKNLFLYIVVSICLVNTHYFGILFVTVNFLFYFVYTIYNKTILVKNTIIFITANIITALSFVPFFVITALRNALLDTGFNSGIAKPNIFDITIAIIIILLAAIFCFYKEKIYKTTTRRTNYNAMQNVYVVYLFFVIGGVFLMAFIFSFIRSIYKFEYYLSIVYPLALVIAALFISFLSRQKHGVYLALFAGYACLLACYQSIPGGASGAFKECTDYIAADSTAHPDKKAVTFDSTTHGNFSFYMAYYGHKDLAVYSPDTNADVLYLPNVYSMIESRMSAALLANGLDEKNVLKIRVSDDRVILKKPLK